MNILQEADEIIHGKRNDDYGSPLANHSQTATLWNTYLNYKKVKEISAKDVCIMNILQKISRYQNKPTRDTIVDIAGYTGNLEMINDEEMLKMQERNDKR